MKKALLYVITILIFLLVGIPIATSADTQTHLKQQELTLEQAREKQREDNRANMAKCLDDARAAWNAALAPDKTKDLGSAGTVFYAYMDSVSQTRQAQIAECQARYAIL